MKTYKEKIEAGLDADMYCDNNYLEDDVIQIKEDFFSAVAVAPDLLEALELVLNDAETELPLYLLSKNGRKAMQAITTAKPASCTTPETKARKATPS